MEVPPLGALVELRPGLERFYNGAKHGWRGMVKDHKVDDGFDLIYVEWDRSYWRFDPSSSQKDGWSYPAHFDVVGQKSATPEQFAAEMVAEAANQPAEDEDTCPTCGLPHTAEDRHATYLQVLSEAANEAAEGEGFALFFVQRERDGDEVVIRPFMISACLTNEGQALVEAQIVQVADTYTRKFMIEYLRKFK